MVNKTLTGVSIIVGSAIGAGILGIPYVVMKSGFTIGLIHLVLIAVMLLITMLYLGEIALRTRESHQLTGYAEKYLGKKGKITMFIAFAFGIYAALLAYMIGEGESFSHLIFNNPDYSIYFGIAFWILMSILTFQGLKALEKGEKIGVILIIILIVGIAIFAVNKIDINNLTYNNPQNALIPFGVILFAYLGFAALPEVEEELGKDKHLMKKTIIISYITIFLVYTIFALIVLGWKGAATPPLATLALGKIFILLGILTMFTSYFALSIALIDTLRFDYKLSKNKSWLITTMTPLILYLLLMFTNNSSFTTVLGIGGVISGGLTAILILLMVPKAKKLGDEKPHYQIPYSKILTTILIIIFIAGALAEIYSIIA